MPLRSTDCRSDAPRGFSGSSARQRDIGAGVVAGLDRPTVHFFASKKDIFLRDELWDV